MTEETNVETKEPQIETMPGADPVSQEEKEGFGIDLSFEGDNENSEETDDIEETAEEDSEAEEETVAETEGDVNPEEETEGAPEGSTAGDDETVSGEVSEPVEEKQKSPMVPKSRLDEVLAKQKALQKQLDEQGQKKAEIIEEPPVYNFDEQEVSYQEAILDGDTAKASSIRNDIRTAERQQVMFEVQQQMGQTVQQSQEMMNLQTTANELSETYPILDENSAEFNPEVQKEVIDLRDAFAVQGYDAADALKKAVNYTLAVQAPELLNVSKEEAVNTPNLKEVNQKKKQATVTKKLEAANAQPPELKGESNSDRGESTLDVKTLSDDEFSALPEETLRRMRGDFG